MLLSQLGSVGLVLTCSETPETGFLVMGFKISWRSFEQFDFMTIGDFEHKFAEIRNDM